MYFIRTKRLTVHKLSFFTLLIISLMFCFSHPLIFQAGAGQQETISANSGQKIQIPEGLPPEEANAYLEGIIDERVRQLMALKLKEEAKDPATMAESDYAGRYWTFVFFYQMAQKAYGFTDQVRAAFSGEKTGSINWAVLSEKLSDGKGGGSLLLTVLVGLVLIACGLGVERLLLRVTEDFRSQLLTAVALGKLRRLGLFISRLLLDALGLAAYILITFVLFLVIYNPGTAAYTIVSIFLIISYYFQVIRFAAKVVFSPVSAKLRLLPMHDDDAEFLYRWILRVTLLVVLFSIPATIFLDVGESPRLFILLLGAAGLGVTILLAVMIWQSRKRVARAIYPGDQQDTNTASPLRSGFAKSWHFFAMFYVLGMGTFWSVKVWATGWGDILNLITSLFLIPIFIGLDQLGQRLLKMASGELPEVIDLSGDDETEAAEERPVDKKTDIKHFAPLIRRAFRIVLIAFLFFIVLRLWGIDLSVGRIFTRTALSIVVALLLGFILWEFTKARIDRKLQEEMPEQDEEMEEGGAGGSRTGTLLVLLRKFVLAVMFVMVSLIILSSIGINIGPLIAGAGVIGLAIGFGAQTLVKDIISGIFFLIDDAFRVGDFIETAGTKGMVEHISLRSLRLRHPRGPVHTIPFGDMGTVTNNSRDYIITKLDFRVRYDTNVDKVRKIIKKINLEIENDEEMGPVMLDKIKSQGVRELDDSAMIMRVKFKTIPGEQFIVRREVYRRIQEAFAANGIEFAHRNVTVYLPPEAPQTASGEEQKKGAEPAGAPNKKLIEVGAAAAIAAAQDDEDAKKPKGQ